MITQVKVGHKYINVSVAIIDDDGNAIDPVTAEAWFYKISQINGSLSLDTNIGGTGIVTLTKQNLQTGFYGTSIDITTFLETEYVILYKIFVNSVPTITVEYLSIDLSKKQVGEIKTDTTSIISTLSTLVVNIWGYGTRTLTSFGTLIADIWSYSTRTLTSFGTLISDIWSYTTRTLTACVKGTEIDAIKERTDNLPDDPASESGVLAKDATVAKEAQATINKDAIITEVNANEVKIDAVKTDTESIIATLSTLVVDVWNYTTRTLTSFGSLVSDIAVAVWTYASRTITSGGIIAAEVWAYITRTLTSGTKDSEIDAIKVETDKIQPEIIDKKDEYKADVTNLATSASINVLEILIKRILGLAQENFRILNTTYDVNSNLISATIKIYPTKNDANGDINAIAVYSMVAGYNEKKEMISYKVVKE